MGRNIGSKNKISRRFNLNLGLKTNASKVARRLNQPPGVHVSKRRQSTSSYGKQLLEKQKAKIIYGLREKQMNRYIKKATAMTGDSGLNLQRMLEMRMDNLVYRAGFAVTRSQARQFVGHNMFLLNGKKMNIPSHTVRLEDVVSLKENKANKKKIFEGIDEKLSKHNLPSWLNVDPAKKSAKVIGLPQTVDFEKLFDVKLVIEYYSTR